MAARVVHLVGSLPGGDAKEAMGEAVARVGPFLSYLPDGETGERRNWVISMVEALRSHPDLEVVKAGDWSDYDKVPRLRVRRGHTFTGETVDLGIAGAAQAARPAFEALRDQQHASSGAAPLQFQVGIPGDIDLALFTFGPAGALRHRRPFTDALLDSMRRVRELYGDDVVFQLEIPAEVVLLSRLPGPARPALARILAGAVATLATGTAPGTQFGLHLCLGDMNHKAFGRIGDAGVLVDLTNAIARKWPKERPLRYVHLPLAHADEPPSPSPAFYAPLHRLRLPPATRIIAGFAHEDQDLDDQRKVRDLVDDAVGVQVGISTSCGLGRRSLTVAQAALDRLAVLAQE